MSLLEIDHLGVDLPVEDAMQTVIHEVTLSIAEGEAVGLVGESGAGKSMTARAVIGCSARCSGPRRHPIRGRLGPGQDRPTCAPIG